MKNKIKIAIFTLIVTVTASVAFGQSFVKYADSLYEKKDYKVAVTAYTKCYDDGKEGSDPFYTEDTIWYCIHRRGMSYFQLKQYQEAINDFSTAIQVKSSEFSYNWRGRANFEIKKYPESINDFTKAIEINPKSNDIFYIYESRARSYFLSKQYSKAIPDYTKVIQIKPTASQYFFRGVSYFNTNKYEESINDFTKAIELNPKSGTSYSGRALVYCTQNKISLAKADEQKAIQLGARVPRLCGADTKQNSDSSNQNANNNQTPTTADGWFKLGKKQLAAKQFKAAEKSLTQSIMLNPKNVSAFEARAETRCQLIQTTSSVGEKEIYYAGSVGDSAEIFNLGSIATFTCPMPVIKESDIKDSSDGILTQNNDKNAGSNQNTNPSTNGSSKSSLTLLTDSSSAMKSCQFQEAANFLTVLIQRSPNDLLHYLSRAKAYGYIDISKAKADLDEASQLLTKANVPLGDKNLIAGQINSLKVSFGLVPANENKMARPKTCLAESNINSGNSIQPVKTQPIGNSRQPTEAEIKASETKGIAFAKKLSQMATGKSLAEANKIYGVEINRLMNEEDVYAGLWVMMKINAPVNQVVPILQFIDKRNKIAINTLSKRSRTNYINRQTKLPEIPYPNDIPLPGTTWNSIAANNANQNSGNSNQNSSVVNNLGFPNIPLESFLPNTADGWFKLGNSQLTAKNNAAAVDSYSRCISLLPSASGCYANRGTAYTGLKKYQEAVNDYSKVIEFQPNNSTIFYQRANAFVEIKKYQEAINDYSVVIKLKPDFVDAYEYRGTAYKNLKKYDEAISDFTKYIQLKPKAMFGYLKRSNAYYDSGKYQEAINDFTKLLEIAPDLTESLYVDRAKAYCKLGQTELAKADEKKTLELGGKVINPCVENSGSVAEQLKKDTTPKTVAPKTESDFDLARKDIETKDYAQAFARAEKIFNSTTKDSSLKGYSLSIIADDFVKANQIDYAKKLLIRALSLEGIWEATKTNSTYALGNIYFTEKNYAKAHEYYNKISDNFDARKNNIKVYYQERNWKQAAALTVSTLEIVSQKYYSARTQTEKQQWFDLTNQFLRDAWGLANDLAAKPTAKADALLIYKALAKVIPTGSADSKAVLLKITELEGN